MIVEIGHYALVLALVLSLAQSVVPLVGARLNDERLMATAAPMASTVFLLVGLSFAALVTAYLRSDFSVLNVYENSHSAKPMIYKFSGTWGNHEGSMLLWILILVAFSALVAGFGRNLPRTLLATVLSVQAWIAVAFLGFLIITSNPFERMIPAPLEGQDLNPLLQDFGLAVHPPLLYLGYVGFSVAFSFAIAALIEGRIDAAWARWVRPWTLLAWIGLTLGISMGSYWAYYELGWGGWWFWDPVENASFMPWLAGTALLHSAIVMEKREALKVWTILLAIITFSLSLLGTFLVRSGVLTSVHAFATDPTRGVVILAILMVFVGGAFALFIWRASDLKAGGLFAPISREGALVANNLFLSVACAAVLIGTLYPLLIEAINGNKISVGPPYFNMTFGALMIPLLMLVPFGSLLSWKRGDLLGAGQRLVAALGLTIVVMFCVALLVDGPSALAPMGIGLAVWLIVGSMVDPLWRAKLGKAPFSETLRRLRNQPRAAWGMTTAHLGLGVMLLGIVAVGAWETEEIAAMRPGDSVTFANYEARFVDMVSEQGPNFQQQTGVFEITRNGEAVATMRPSKRLYPARQMPTTEAAIHTIGFSQLYISLGEVQQEGRALTVRVYEKPLVTLIWLGSLVMALGGCLSLSDRRVRFGAPTPNRRRQEVVVPAE